MSTTPFKLATKREPNIFLYFFTLERERELHLARPIKNDYYIPSIGPPLFEKNFSGCCRAFFTCLCVTVEWKPPPHPKKKKSSFHFFSFQLLSPPPHHHHHLSFLLSSSTFWWIDWCVQRLSVWWPDALKSSYSDKPRISYGREKKRNNNNNTKNLWINQPRRRRKKVLLLL